MVAFILIAIAGICKAVSDTLIHHFMKSIFHDNKRFTFDSWQWWNPEMSWALKWHGKDIDKERFPGSSTIFVWLTDGWHFFNMLQYTAVVLAIVFYNPVYSWWIDAILLKCVFTITFEVFYKWVLIKKHPK